MKRPAPILCLLLRTRVERNELRGQLADALEREDRLKGDVAVWTFRARWWRGRAFKWGGGHPEAMCDLTWRAMSDDIADIPELDERARNAGPRSIP